MAGPTRNPRYRRLVRSAKRHSLKLRTSRGNGAYVLLTEEDQCVLETTDLADIEGYLAPLDYPERLPGEEWRDVPGYEGEYQISSTGRMWSYPRERTSRGILKPVVNGRYLRVALRGTDSFRVHELVCLAFYGPRPKGMVTRHLNDNGLDNRLENLRYGTESENRYDMWDNGGRLRLNARTAS